MTMNFDQRRRQVFLGEAYYKREIRDLDLLIADFATQPAGSGDTELEGWMISWRNIASMHLQALSLAYTAGDPIEPLRWRLERAVAAQERHGEFLWKPNESRNEPVLEFDVLDSYVDLMQLIGLCFLLHRRDLLPRIAALQDGDNGALGGSDTLYEEFMAFGMGPDTRYESDWLCHKRIYEPLFHGLTETTPEKGLRTLDLFLKHWYRNLAGTTWHDSHKPDEAGNQGGYFGYWSFEAGAAVILLGIEDDSSLHKYLYYPKDLVAWSRQHAELSAQSADKAAALGLRAREREPCPRSGFWHSPALMNSRRHFQAGELMPSLGGDYGVTIWQWDENQEP